LALLTSGTRASMLPLDNRRARVLNHLSAALPIIPPRLPPIRQTPSRRANGRWTDFSPFPCQNAPSPLTFKTLRSPRTGVLAGKCATPLITRAVLVGSLRKSGYLSQLQNYQSRAPPYAQRATRTEGGLDKNHLMPTTMLSAPASGSRRVFENPTSRIQPIQSDAV
jgi:hypothetical protein